MVPTDRFRVGSITKTFTATVLLQLVQEGRLSLSDPISDHVPGFDLDPGVTVERLLSHTSGVFNYTDDPGFLIDAQVDAEPRDIISFALENEAYFAPGQGYTYSNTGFFLLALAMEAVTGQSYHDLVRTRLLGPYRLDDTWLDGVESHEPPLVDGHVLGTDVGEVGFSMSWAWASGGMASNIQDICDWLHRLYLGDVLGTAMRDRMRTPMVLLDGQTTTYGFGTALAQRGGWEVVGHTGSTMGFRGEAFIQLDTGICVAVLSNDFFGEQDALAHPLWAAIAAWWATR